MDQDFAGLLDPSSIVARPVDVAVNSVRNNGAHLLDPVPLAEVPAAVTLPWEDPA